MRLFWLLLILVIIGGGFWFFLSSDSPSPERSAVPLERGLGTPTNNSGLADYTNSAYKVALKYPASWQPDSPAGIAGEGTPIRYVGEDGFFSIDALAEEGDSLDAAVQSLAAHRLQPYGSDPKILKVKIAGQEAAYIFPSQDQPVEARGEAVLVVRYPEPVEVEVLPGMRESYNFFVLYAAKDQIEKIAPTVDFVK